MNGAMVTAMRLRAATGKKTASQFWPNSLPNLVCRVIVRRRADAAERRENT
jgi:hypothetical protein